MDFKPNRPDNSQKPLINIVCCDLQKLIENSKQNKDIDFCINGMTELLVKCINSMSVEEYDRYIQESLYLGKINISR